MGRNRLLVGAPAPLSRPTYDRSGQSVHPDVIAVDPAIYGHKLLMVMEPYPYGDDYLENPSLLCSDDGLRWVVPEGIVNPIVEPPSQRGPWNSDADLVISRDQQLFLYYRYNSGMGETTLLRKTTRDGFSWSAPETIFTVAISGRFASPALVEMGHRFFMYYVDTIQECVRLAISTDGFRWSDDRTLFAFKDAWHIDAARGSDWVYLLLNDKKSLFLLRSADQLNWWLLDGDSWRNLNDFDATSAGGPVPLLEPSERSWDDGLIYRSTLLVEPNLLRLWYGAKSTNNVWRVGYSDAPFRE